ncbi:DNA glycosylase [Nemania abortiva]|nr:DNA glycosylase [Nemania abortiva]
MAKTTTRSKKTGVVADGPVVRRRSARHVALEIRGTIDEPIVKDEGGSKSESESESEGRNENEGEVAKMPAKRRLADSLPPVEVRRSKRVKSEKVTELDELVKEGKARGKTRTKKDMKPDTKLSVGGPSPASPPRVKIEAEAENDDEISNISKPKKTTTTTTTTAAAAADLQAKKLKSYSQFAAARQSPYPDFARPSAEECKLAHKILASLHGERIRPEETKAPASRAGCGDSASVLDALVRTILSQNTSDTNSSRAKLAMDAAYGSSCAWARIVEGGEARLAKAIESGGLAVVKSRAIISILRQTHARYGAYSLDHLFGASDDEAMRELLAFKGVGPKTASCVLLFCLRRASFAVDTHVHRITGLLGWRPADATRDLTHAHLDARIPDEDKYGLHVLLVRHGKECAECRAGGKNLGRCELRRAFRKGKVMGEAGEEAQGDEARQIKAEEEEEEDDDDVDMKG